MKKFKEYKWLIIMILFIIIIINLKKESWSGFFYPDKNDLSRWGESSSKFKSLDECRNWAKNKAIALNLDNTVYDYECGLNCKYKDGFNVCNKTLD